MKQLAISEASARENADKFSALHRVRCEKRDQLSDVLINQPVRFTGDTCNAERTGTIHHIYSDRFGHLVVIKWDDPSTIGYGPFGGGERIEPFTTIGRHAIKPASTAGHGDRFRLTES